MILVKLDNTERPRIFHRIPEDRRTFRLRLGVF